MAEYSQFNEFNRYQNLDGLEAKIVTHLVQSTSKHAQNFWKLLKYNDLNALSQNNLSEAEKWDLVCYDNGDPTKKRVFFAPFVDDAWQEQCASVYIFVDAIIPIDHLKSTIHVNVETIVHSKISAVTGDGDSILNPQANPNDSDAEGQIVVAFKNRATVLLKCVLAELNGLYLDGIGYLQLNPKLDPRSKSEMPLWNNRSFYGHSTVFCVEMSGASDRNIFGF